MQRARGFTLVEMIMVIVITGIIGGMVAVFLRAPIQQYVDVARRAEMTDIADTALRRISRDLRTALPNSIRRAGVCGALGTECLIEYLPTRGGGRYRRDVAPVGNPSAGCGSLAADVLDIAVADTCFEALGPASAFTAGDQVVVYNLGIAGADAYEGSNRSARVAGALPIINFTSFSFPFGSPGGRFQIVSTPVAYACDGLGKLWRYWGYVIQAAPPDTIAALDALIDAQGARALLANNVTVCRFTYSNDVVAQRSGLVSMNLGIGRDGETVTLYSATHVSNLP